MCVCVSSYIYIYIRVCVYTYVTTLAGKHVLGSHCGHTKVNSSTLIFVEGSLFALVQFPRVRYLSELRREQFETLRFPDLQQKNVTEAVVTKIRRYSSTTRAMLE